VVALVCAACVIGRRARFFNRERSEMNGDETDVANGGDNAQLKDVVGGRRLALLG